MRSATREWSICIDCKEPIYLHEAAGGMWLSVRQDGGTTRFCTTIGGHMPGGSAPVYDRTALEEWLA